MANLLGNELPNFSQFNADEVVEAITRLVEQNRAFIEQILAAGAPTWQHTLLPIELSGVRLEQLWSALRQMSQVIDSESLRSAYSKALPLISDFSTELGQNQKLFAAYSTVRHSNEYDALGIAEKKIIENALLNFHLNGIDLQPQERARYAEIRKLLSERETKFKQNVLDSTQAWSKLVTNVSDLAGLPAYVLQQCKARAESKGLEGYLLSLDMPTYVAIMTFAANREIRREVYTAYCIRATARHCLDVISEGEAIFETTADGCFDNEPLMVEILNLRRELALLLGYQSFAHYSLARKMAPSPQAVLDLLREVGTTAKPQAQRELASVTEFAVQSGAILNESGALDVWDVNYYSEKQKLSLYDFSDETLRPYLPLERALAGMFQIANCIYGIAIERLEGVEVWHPDVRFYVVRQHDQVIAGFYLDPFAREGKAQGAWMEQGVPRARDMAGNESIPIVYLATNSASPSGDQPALLSHRELITLLHEFGHGLHGMLSQMVYPSISGINGVEWDGVELPSQFNENWAWQGETLRLLSANYESNEPLPQAMIDRVLGARNFQSALFTVRQLEFGLFDFLLHMHEGVYSPEVIQSYVARARMEVAAVIPPEFNRYQNAFTHIFGPDYAAGYYSYMWADVLAADAFAAFQEEGLLNPETGKRFLNTVLANGGSRSMRDLFYEFRGREPNPNALLKRLGLLNEDAWQLVTFQMNIALQDFNPEQFLSDLAEITGCPVELIRVAHISGSECNSPPYGHNLTDLKD